MNEWKTQVKTKSFYSKNAMYKKKKIRSLLFPCTVFHSDKTSRLHAAQTKLSPRGSRKAHHAGTAFLLCTASNAPSQTEPRPTPVSRQGTPTTEGTTAAVPTESLHPSKHRSTPPPKKGPQVRREKKKTKQNTTIKSSGSSQWKLGRGRPTK